MLTEKEAKAKWCPHFPAEIEIWKPADEPVRHVVREYARCHASACMAWRWSFTFVNAGGMEIEGDTRGTFAQLIKEGARRKGFCGMAGRPE